MLISPSFSTAYCICAGGYHRCQLGEIFNDGRYMALQKLGWGHFSTVWLVYDKREERVAALKIQKSATRYTEAAADEVEMLVMLNTHKGEDRTVESIVTLLDHFFHYGPHGKHMCMVFELMGQSLLSLIRAYDYKVRSAHDHSAPPPPGARPH
eukprot:SAG11_NODE_2002_length_3938_cov_2.562126_4_plen_153_part_00